MSSRKKVYMETLISSPFALRIFVRRQCFGNYQQDESVRGRVLGFAGQLSGVAHGVAPCELPGREAGVGDEEDAGVVGGDEDVSLPVMMMLVE
jgi:hypothetical protein